MLVLPTCAVIINTDTFSQPKPTELVVIIIVICQELITHAFTAATTTTNLVDVTTAQFDDDATQPQEVARHSSPITTTSNHACTATQRKIDFYYSMHLEISMLVKGLHLLLTYKCTYECDHCFVYSSPNSPGVMQISQINQILKQAERIKSIETIYFEGGEPFLYYPTMLWGLKKAKKAGYKTGIVTNAYWATSVEDAKHWLKPIATTGLDNLSVSDDAFHYGEQEENLAKYANEAAKDLDLPVNNITIEEPKKYLTSSEWEGKPVTGGAVLFKGRAVEKLVQELPKKPWQEFARCSSEDFSNQKRVHIDPLGYVHVCQGITIGNMKNNHLHELFEEFAPNQHPICGPILKGGPAELVRKYKINHDESYVDECHLCYDARLKLREKFPDILAPNQMYGVFT